MTLRIKKECPKCGNTTDRIRRILTDRIFCLFSEPFACFRRYRCSQCNWEGLKKR